MLNISNMERVSKILEMKPEDITRYDIKAGTKKYKSNTDEGWELTLALRELDNGKAEKLNQKAKEDEELLIKLRKEEENYRRSNKEKQIEKVNQGIKIIKGVADGFSIFPDPKIKFASAVATSTANIGDAIINKDKNMTSEDDIELVMNTGKELYNKTIKFMKGLKRR